MMGKEQQVAWPLRPPCSQCGGLEGHLRKNGPHVELRCASCSKHQKFVAKPDLPQRVLREFFQ